MLSMVKVTIKVVQVAEWQPNETCFQSLKTYFNQTNSTQPVHNDSQISPILFINNLRLFGSYDECLSIDVKQSNNLSFHGVYCRAKLNVSNLNPLHPNVSEQMSMGLCAPSTCSTMDIENLLAIQNNVIEAKVLSCHGRSPETLDSSEIVVICVLIILGLVVLLGTSLSTYFRLCGHKPFRKRAKILIAFSVYENSLKLMDPKTSDKNISCLSGLRFIALCFIVLGHTYSYHSQISIVDPESVQIEIKKLWFQVFLNFTPWVDTFFLISGLLVTYGGLDSYKKIFTNDDSMLKCAVNSMKTMGASIAHRYLRMTPTLAFTICIYIVAGKIGSGPEWSFMQSISNPCKLTWWRNLIYINNFFSSNVCIGHTWYLADDFQFYIFSTFILVLLSSSVPVVGLSIIGSALFASIMATAVTTFVTHSSVTPLAVSIDGSSQTIQEVHLYIWPFFRVGPFLIGILLGYVILRYGDIGISKRINVSLWVLCLSTVTVVTMASYRWTNGHPASLFESVVYSSLHRIIWSICWSYMIVSCHYGHCPLVNNLLGWKAFVPLGKLTYHAYLIHLLFIYMHIASNRTTINFSHYNMFILYLGYLTISMLFSYVSAILFELPFANLENIFWPKKLTETVQINGQISASQSTGLSNNYQSETIDDRFINIFQKPENQNNNVLVY
uniref:Nose resistant-to-fluoxetine protein N-terminal domain-containing protein n=1 Tax=Tetranychus urticae TaxID=32264 RepID=T1KMM1_TETUR